MNDKRENKFSRNLKVETYFNNHEAELVPSASILADFITQYRTKNVELTTLAMKANEDITGSSTEKTMLRNTMRDYAVGVSGALYSYFLSINKPKPAQKAYLTKSDLDNARDTDVYVNCKWVLEKAQEFSTEIIPFGVSDQKLVDLNTAIEEYYVMIQDPQNERGNKSSAMADFDVVMKESEDVLEIIKGIMLMLKADFPSLHMQFMSACAIDDNIGGGSPLVPDFEFTVNPGDYFTGTSIPYLASRKFKAKNLSLSSTIQWGLSTSETLFTGTSVPLNANSESTLLSTTLGGSGDFLVFYNPSGEAVQVELTIIED